MSSSKCAACGARTQAYGGYCQRCKSLKHHGYKRIKEEGLILDQAGGSWWIWNQRGDVLVSGKSSAGEAAIALAAGEDVHDNPYVGKQPDLFGGETRRYVPLEDMTDEELEKLSLEQFTDAELAELPARVLMPVVEREMAQGGSLDRLKKLTRDSISDDRFEALPDDVKEYIHEHDPASRKRIDDLADRIIDQFKWEPDAAERDRDAEETFEMFLGEDDLIDVARRASDYDVDDLIESWVADGFSQEQVEEALKSAMQDSNNWEFTSGSEYGPAFYKVKYNHPGIYIESSELKDLLDGMHEDEIDAAMEKIDSETYLSGKEVRKDINRALESKYGTLEIEVDSDDYTDIDPKWDDIAAAVKESLEGEEPEGGDQEPPPLDESRVVMRFKDGAYVYDLTPADLPKEGRTMGHCVGRPGMGYGHAVHGGQIKILSLRTQNGRPKFTIEAQLAQSTDYSRQRAPNKWGITKLAQVKGKANRLPGWDLGKVGQGEMKREEVDKILALVEKLGLDPNRVRDLEPAMARLEGEESKRLTGNPRGPACGAYGAACTGFCLPYGSHGER